MIEYDAMIEYSGALVIGQDEWLTVAAKDDEPGGPFAQGNPHATIVLLRIKGSDLAAFCDGRACTSASFERRPGAEPASALQGTPFQCCGLAA